MEDWKRSSAPGWDHPPRLLTRHGMITLTSVYAPVPAWEKRFVTDICGIQWKRLLETEKMMPVYKNIVDWDDSGAPENFQNAKDRFWAELNGFPCDIPPPEQDLYIDKIDYFAEFDPELIADLEKPPLPRPATAGKGWDSFSLAERQVSVTGWVNLENKVKTNLEVPAYKPIVATGWGDEGYYAPHTGFVVPGLVSGFSATEQKGKNGCNYGGGVPKNSGDSWNYNADWHQNKLCERGQYSRNERNTSWVAWENNAIYDNQRLAMC